MKVKIRVCRAFVERVGLFHGALSSAPNPLCSTKADYNVQQIREYIEEQYNQHCDYGSNQREYHFTWRQSIKETCEKHLQNVPERKEEVIDAIALATSLCYGLCFGFFLNWQRAARCHQRLIIIIILSNTVSTLHLSWVIKNRQYNSTLTCTRSAWSLLNVLQYLDQVNGDSWFSLCVIPENDVLCPDVFLRVRVDNVIAPLLASELGVCVAWWNIQKKAEWIIKQLPEAALISVPGQILDQMTAMCNVTAHYH